MEAERVLITGTTSGQGRALLEHYVRSGARVVAVNRRRVPELELEFPAARFECVDVRDAPAVEALVNRLHEAGELCDVFFLNAGINRVDNDEAFDLSAYKEVLETNLYGPLHFVAPLTRLARGKSPRHVVAISSLAGSVGNPYGVGYHTSKRALTACFDVWADMYAGTDLVFHQVILGPVPTSTMTMASRFPGWMVAVRDAFSGSLEGTARQIAQFATTERKRLVTPRRAVPLYAGMWLGRRLIPGFFRGRKTLDGAPRRGQ
jgi:NAD(P)-dependent dehydrogenase (short-subunit alcohol dehydrogenase family)